MKSRRSSCADKTATGPLLYAAPCHPWVKLFALIPMMLAGMAACSRGGSVAASKEEVTSTHATAEAMETATQSATPADLGPSPQINSQRAFQYLKEVVAFGPRPIGSENHKKLENYILAHLRGDEVEDDAFTADTVEGKFPVRNIIAKYPGTKDGVIVVVGHYDTLYGPKNASFVGANDGGSSTAILLELANQLRGKKRDGYSVWLVWSDGEEAVRQWTDTDSLYGTRHLAERWEKDGTLKRIRALFVLDMIGDADLNIDKDTNSAPWLSDLMLQAASSLGYQSHFYARTGPISDDHLPFIKRGVPTLDVIDFDYGYNNVFWHTPQDTLDKLSPKSLEIVGNTTLQAIRMIDRR